MMAVHKGVGHYGAPITLDQAKKVMAATEAKARQNDWNVVISIVDSGGHAVMLQRLDGSHLAAIGIAEGKARTAVEFRRPTKALEDAMAGGGVGLKYFTVRGATLIELWSHEALVIQRGDAAYRDPTAWLGMWDSNSEMSTQIIPLKDGTDLRESSRILALETIRV
jgi:Haem-degrading